MGLLSGIGKVFDGAKQVLGGVGQIAKGLGGILNSPLGNLLKMAFPGLALAQPMLNFAGMAGDLASGIGGSSNY